MADAAVEFLLKNLQQVLVYHANLIRDAKEQVVALEKDLRLLRAYLKDTTANRSSGEMSNTLQQLTRDIRDVVYEAEDIIDTFISQANELNSQSRFFRPFKKAANLHDIAPQVQHIGVKVRKILDGEQLNFANINIVDGASKGSLEDSIVKQDNVVGIDEEADTIIKYLKENTDYPDVISIIGMPGLGKTTLAREVFNNEEIQREFHIRIWVYVSQEFNKRNVFLAILEELTTVTKSMYEGSDNELARLIETQLKNEKFLIVMDDVWTGDDWKKIEIALPKSNTMGKVLITSRHREVAQVANRHRPAHRMPGLSDEDSWLLLKHEVFGKSKCPSELEGPGREIARHCGGLPLAIVVIGGILVKKFSTSEDMPMKKVVDTWCKVSQNFGAFINSEQRMVEIILLSYNILPPHLRQCFLYLGMFPEDFEIPVKKLIRMWVAEGFIEQKDDISVEETAESYLDDLIRWNLVRIDKWRSDGGVKTCRIHDMLREFCIREAGNDNFFQEVKKILKESRCLVSADQKYRRICVHSNIRDFISPALSFPRVRSFICFSKSDPDSPLGNTSDIPVAFKLIRVLDVASIKFSKVPKNMYKLLHLRYIVLSLHSAVLPLEITKLWNLETLIVHTTSRTLEIKADIWKLSQLRHLKTNASALLPKAGNIPRGENLQTLEAISPQSCTEKVFGRCRSVKKLGIRGKLALLVDKKTEPFDRLRKLSNLEKLKLFNDVTASLQRLPPVHQFPPKLKSLILCGTLLDWTHMEILRLLKNLEVLKLKDGAFHGTLWEVKDVEDGGFLKLDFLHIGRTNLTVWKASHEHFPKLKCLELHNCMELTEIPVALADISSFKTLDLQHSSNHAVISAKKIHAMKKESLRDGEFKLSIFPPTAVS